MPHPLWQSLARDAGLELSATQLGQLDRYLDLLIEWNEKINLTRIVNREDAEVKHVADALTLLKFLPKRRDDGGGRRDESRSSLIPHRSPLSLADVGTGGGVPGVPLAICRPDIKVTLIDSTKKKLDAIAKIVSEISLTNVATLHTRIEQAKMGFDVITARAVADLDTLIGWCQPLMKPTTVLLAMKGPKAAEELAAAGYRLQRMKRGARIHAVAAAELAGHCVVRIA
jgi:16S rRNA (guanine527-N7)-methyltransferase